MNVLSCLDNRRACIKSRKDHGEHLFTEMPIWHWFKSILDFTSLSLNATLMTVSFNACQPPLSYAQTMSKVIPIPAQNIGLF